MTALPMILSIAYFIVSLTLIVLVLMQQKDSQGLGGGMSGMGSTPSTYWDKNKGRSLEGKLHTYTKVFGTIFIVLSLLLTTI